MVTMSQKSSLIQPANFVSQALIPDTARNKAEQIDLHQRQIQ
jgi:hypothetical protein